jgi:pimeloyl-ACP methyl ester carboxylesterase
MADISLIEPPIRSMSLADGRQLTWREFGTPDAKPVLYFHGGGSFSLEAGLFHREAVERGIRLVCPNRPGADGSSECPGRPVAGYSDDLRELLGRLGIGKFACLGESNGGMVTLAVAKTMHDRVLGAVPINPTVPWFDPMARRVSPAGIGWAYRMMKIAPRLLRWMAKHGVAHARRTWLESRDDTAAFHPRQLMGPPPGTEPDVAELQWKVTLQSRERGGLVPELAWASSEWGFDFYSIPVPLDFFCGVYDAQAPFALVLSNRNPDARFHSFSYGHNAFSHPDARRRIFDRIASYFPAN